jgi:hypothetical protein
VLAFSLILSLSLTACGDKGGDNDLEKRKEPNDDTITGKWKKAGNISFDINEIVFGNGKFVAVGDNSSGGKMATSADGITWTDVSSTTFTYGIEAIVYAEDKNMFVAGGILGKMWTSTNGSTWTPVSDSKLDSIDVIAYGGGMFVAGGGGNTAGKMAFSTDGSTWTLITNHPFVGIGNDVVNAIAYGNGKFIAVSGSGKMASSIDGSIWTSVTHPFGTGTDGTGYIYDIDYGNNKFIAIGYNKEAYLSDGATTWTALSSVPLGVAKIIFANNMFIGSFAYPTRASIRTSADGITWSANYDTGSSGPIQAIAYGKGTYVVATRYSAYNYIIYYSTGF